MLHARPPICVVLLVAAALSAGCQSGVERDIVQREMRQQEDQIYALEDYLSEYQQLLCDVRSENAELKQQLVKGQFRDDGSGNGSERPVTRPSRGTSPPGTEPSILPPAVPPLDFSEPAVPPLDEQSATEPTELDNNNLVQLAAAEIEVVAEAATGVVLRGEVRRDEADEQIGPRVLVEVKPVDDRGQLTEFHGRLSLLVLDPAARDGQQQLARWDFQSSDLQTQPGEHGTLYEFPLQLPAEVPTDRPVELWVRLMPEDGEKLLASTVMDLGRAGQFASADVKPAKEKQHAVRVAEAELTHRPSPRRAVRKIDSNVQQSGWQTAKPGQVARPSAAASKSHSEWKTATRPVPEVESTPVVASKSVRRFLPPSETGGRYDAATAAEWSPERPDDGAAKTPYEPSWSPTR